jgi:hypothetical protein
MVQRPTPLQQGDFAYQRENTWPRNDRSFLDIPQDGRFVSAAPPQTPIHSRLQVCSSHIQFTYSKLTSKTIDTALKECAGVNVKQWALIARLDNGQDEIYSSQSLVEYRESIFNDSVRDVFRRSVRRARKAENAFQNPGNSMRTSIQIHTDLGFLFSLQSRRHVRIRCRCE